MVEYSEKRINILLAISNRKIKLDYKIENKLVGHYKHSLPILVEGSLRGIINSKSFWTTLRHSVTRAAIASLKRPEQAFRKRYFSDVAEKSRNSDPFY